MNKLTKKIFKNLGLGIFGISTLSLVGFVSFSCSNNKNSTENSSVNWNEHVQSDMNKFNEEVKNVDTLTNEQLNDKFNSISNILYETALKKSQVSSEIDNFINTSSTTSETELMTSINNLIILENDNLKLNSLKDIWNESFVYYFCKNFQNEWLDNSRINEIKYNEALATFTNDMKSYYQELESSSSKDEAIKTMYKQIFSLYHSVLVSFDQILSNYYEIMIYPYLLSKKINSSFDTVYNSDNKAKLLGSDINAAAFNEWFDYINYYSIFHNGEKYLTNKGKNLFFNTNIYGIATTLDMSKAINKTESKYFIWNKN